MSDESRADEIVASWRERRDGGADESPDDVVRAHPDLADSLRARFEAMAAADEALRGGPQLRVLPDGRYASFRVAGEGGMGIVYWALDTDLNRQVAFKVVRPDLGATRGETPSAPLGLVPPTLDTPASQAFDTLKHRFLQEAWVTAGLEHPGIVPVYELGETPEGVPYYTMRFVRGSRTLGSAIADAAAGGVEARFALLEPFLKVCDTLRYAHAHGVIHRDLKPENVALGEFGEVVVLDWGLAKMRDAAEGADDAWRERVRDFRAAADLRTLASALGTPGYMAPEAALGRVAEVEERSDVYSLGAILFQILTGRLPFTFTTYGELVRQLMEGSPRPPHEIDPAVPEGLSSICVRALARNKEARPASVDALAGEVRNWLARREEERELDLLRREARAALDAAAGLEGGARLAEVDRAAAACTQILARRPDDEAALALSADIHARRDEAIAEKERLARGRTLRRAAVVALGVATVAAVVVAVLLDERRRETEVERDAKEHALTAATVAQRETEAALGATRAERDAKDAALRRTRALALVGAAKDALAREQPALALRLAREAVLAASPPVPESVENLYAALDAAVPSVVFRGHADSVLSSAVSRKGDRVLTLSRDGSARLWDLEGRTLAVLGGRREVVGFSSTPTGFRAALASIDGAVEVRDATGRVVSRLEGHFGVVRSMAFAAASDRMVTASADGTARLWDSSGRCTATLAGHLSDLTAVAITPDGSRVATASYDGTARLWDGTGHALAVLRGHIDAVRAVALAADGRRVVTGSDDGTARVFDASGRELCALRGHDAPVVDVAVAPTGRMLTRGDDGTVRVWNPDGTALATLGSIDEPATADAFAEDGERAVVGFGDGSVVVWEGGAAPARTVGRLGDAVTSVDLAADGGIAAADASGAVRVWDAAGVGRCSIAAGAPVSRVRCDGSRVMVATATSDIPPDLRLYLLSWRLDRLRERMRVSGEVGAWDTATGRRVNTVCPAADELASAAFCGTDRIVTGSMSGSVAYWSAEDGALVSGFPSGGLVARVVPSPAGDLVLVVPAHAKYLLAVGPAVLFDAAGSRRAAIPCDGSFAEWLAFDPTGTRVLTIVDMTARLVDLDGREIAVFKRTGDPGPQVPDSARVANFAGQGDCVVTFGLTGEMAVWDFAGKRLGGSFNTTVDFAAVGSNGNRVLGVGHDGNASLLDLSGGITMTCRTHSGRRWAVTSGDSVFGAIDREGTRVLTVGDEHVARVRDLEGIDVAVLGDHGGTVRSATFVTGDRVLTSSEDGTARLWQLGRPVHRRPVGGNSRAAAFLPDERGLVFYAEQGNAEVLDADGRRIASFGRYDGPSFEPAFSPDGARIVVADWNCTARLTDRDGRDVAVLAGHRSAITTAAFAPDGSSVVTVSCGEGVARRWDRDGRLVADLGMPKRRVLGARFAADGSRLVLACAAEGPRPPAESGIAEVFVPGERVRHADPSPSGDRVLVVEDGIRLRVYGADGSELAEPTYLSKYSDEPRFSPRGRYIVRGGMGEESSPFRDAAGRDPSAEEGAEKGTRREFSPDEEHVVRWTAGGAASLCDAAGAVLVTLGGAELHAVSAAFSHRGDRVAVGTKDRGVQIFAVPSGERVAVAPLPRTAWYEIAFLPDDSGLLVAVEQERGMPASRLVVALDGSVRATFVCPIASTSLPAVAVSASGDRLLLREAADRDLELHALDGRTIATVWKGSYSNPEPPVLGSFVSPRGDRVLTVSRRSVYLWEPGGRLVAPLHGGKDDVASAGFSPSGDRLVAADRDGRVRVWDADGRELSSFEAGATFAALTSGGDVLTVGTSAELRDLAGKVRWRIDGVALGETRMGESDGPPTPPVALLPAGDGVVAAVGSEAVLVGMDGARLARFSGHDAGLTCVGTTPDGSRILTASIDGTARVWARDGKALAVLRGHQGPVWSVAASAGGLYATGGADHTTRLWDSDGRQIAVFLRNDSAAGTVAFSPTGRQLVACAADGSDPAFLVDVDVAGLVETAGRRIPHPFDAEEAALLGDLVAPARLAEGLDAKALRAAGWSDLLLGEPREAVKQFARAAVAAPDDPSIQLELARAKLAAGDVEGAIVAFGHTRALVGDVTAEDWLVACGRLPPLAHTDTAAVALWQRVSESDPQSAEAWARLGAARLKNGDRGPALDALDRSMTCSGDGGSSLAVARLHGRWGALDGLERSDEALAALAAARAAGPWNADVLAAVADRDEATGDWTGAARSARLAQLALKVGALTGRRGRGRDEADLARSVERTVGRVAAFAAARRSVPRARALVIAEVDPGYQAVSLGIRPGDVIVRIDGTSVASVDEFKAAWASVPVDRTATVVLLREGAEVEVHPLGGRIGVVLVDLQATK